MTTKEQERKALEKIRKVLDEIGEGYVQTAFSGCLEDAQRNIEEDAAYSMQDRVETAYKTIADQQTEIETLRREKQGLAVELEKARQQMLLDESRIGEAFAAANKARRDITIRAAGEEERKSPFGSLVFVQNGGHPFVTVFEQSGFATSYRIGEIEKLTIE